MLYGDQTGRFHAIGQFGDTTKISLTANTPTLVTLDEASIYRIVPLDIIYVVQSNVDTITATVDDAIIMYNAEVYFNTFDGKKYLSLISEADCEVFITKMS